MPTVFILEIVLTSDPKWKQEKVKDYWWLIDYSSQLIKLTDNCHNGVLRHLPEIARATNLESYYKPWLFKYYMWNQMFFQQFWWIWLEIYNPSIDLVLIDGHQHYIITPNINVDFGNVFFSSLVPLQNTIGVAHWYIGVSKVQVHILKTSPIEAFL